FLRFRCSRTKSTLRSGSRKPLFSARPDLNLDTHRVRRETNGRQTWISPVRPRPAGGPSRRPFGRPTGAAGIWRATRW
ncbi:MAG: hypothetical protein E5Y30_32370, partial [Mesorhizobium sp.]